MLALVGRRLVALLPVLFGISLLVFVLTAVSLGDPVRAAMGQRGEPAVIAQIRRDYGLDEPLWADGRCYWTVEVRLGERILRKFFVSPEGKLKE